MKAISKYIVKLDTSEINVEKGTYRIGSTQLYLPVGQENDYKMMPYLATVQLVPETNAFKLSVGDKVLIDPFVYDNYVEGDLRYINEYNPLNPLENMIYGVVRDNEFRMLINNMLVERTKKEVSSSFEFKTNPLHEISNKSAIVKYIHDDCAVPVGKKIAVLSEHFWPVNLFGEEAFMVNSRFSVPFYYDEGEIVLLPDWVLVEPKVKTDGYAKTKSGLLIPSFQHNDINKAEIIMLPDSYEGPLEKGMEVVYKRQDLFKLKSDKDYYFANISKRYREILAY